ncbi:pentapeptide repeat-containing protein [Nostoc cycadae]|uniref:Pentapeptide repeat protein n=1 Tax=Nostoc cycadae WK-1 TaxID=1861711 RepID=A0A2H6LR69_9NOSO|nr:pentapeptide repeat-containing protein [Nostoc cycadae]GBE95723.1 pentapeptide repeat protein [Nostoc cycadae WK-1]
MAGSSLSKTKNKITYIASIEGLERANKALKRLGFASKENFAKSILLSRSTITKFFQRQPIQFDSFKKICDELKLLDWTEIAELLEREQSNGLVKNDFSSPDINEGEEQVQIIRRQVSVIDKDNKTIKAVILLEGDINSVNNDLSVSIELFLRKYSGHSIKITDIKEGSIKIFIEGSQEDIERLKHLIDSGELTTISDFPVQNIQVLSESSERNESTESDDKWRLVQEIVSQAVKNRNLSDVDLSDADLSDANLSGADLSGADLSGADLRGANLRGANLRLANLRLANLRLANLIDANLSGANLIDANLINADLSGANLRLANLRLANLISTDLSSTDLSSTDLSSTDLIDANLIDANLIDAALRTAYLSNADLRSANLSSANLSGANLRTADLRLAHLIDAELIASALS